MDLRSSRGLFIALAALILAGCPEGKLARREAAPADPLAHAAGDLPLDADAILDALLADDLQVVQVKDINGTVARLTVERGGRRFRLKWKPVGPGGSEEQDGYDGNNAPRCEVAAFRLDRAVFGPKTTARNLVPPVVVRAFHRHVPCSSGCARLPRLSGDVEPTFPELNEHLALGAVAWWLDGVGHLETFHGGLWNAERFRTSAEYRRSFSDLALFLFLINHGDANYSPNFLARMPAIDRLYSIDNGRALDGVSHYTDEADPDWQPFAELAPERLVAPAFSRDTLERLRRLDLAALSPQLRVAAAVNLRTGESPREPTRVEPFASRSGLPLKQWPELRRVGRGVYTGRVDGTPWVVFGVGDAALQELSKRRHSLIERLESSPDALF